MIRRTTILAVAASVSLGGCTRQRGSDQMRSGDADDGKDNEDDWDECGGLRCTLPEGDWDDDWDGDWDDNSFLGVPDVASSDCDPWNPSCADGEKCTTVARSLGFDWDGPPVSVCVPTGPEAPGESCTRADGPLGTDTCDATSLCLGADDVGGEGHCVAFCVGPASSPSCPAGVGPSPSCRAEQAEGMPHLCFSDCDPVQSDACSGPLECVDPPAHAAPWATQPICVPT